MAIHIENELFIGHHHLWPNYCPGIYRTFVC